MMAQFLDYTLDILHNNPIDSLKQGALLLIEASTLIYPKAIGLRLSDIRDAVRLMFIDDNTYTTELASRIYDIVFSIVPENQIDEFYKYLINEISLITKKGLEAYVRPSYISNLNIEESERVSHQ